MRLVGFFTKKSITMHGNMNVKFYNNFAWRRRRGGGGHRKST